MSRSSLAGFVILGLLWVSGDAEAQRTRPPGREVPAKVAGGKLYDDLGGVHQIASMIDDLITMYVKVQESLSKSKQIAPRAALEPNRIPLAKYHVTLFVCTLAEGPQKFAGPKLGTAAAGLQVTPEAFKQLEAAVPMVMAKYGIAQAVQEEVMRRLEVEKKEILASSAKPGDPPPPIEGRGDYQWLGGDGFVSLFVTSFMKGLPEALGAERYATALKEGKLSAPGIAVNLIDALCEQMGGPQRAVEAKPLAAFKFNRNDSRAIEALVEKVGTEFKLSREHQRAVSSAFRRIL